MLAKLFSIKVFFIQHFFCTWWWWIGTGSRLPHGLIEYFIEKSLRKGLNSCFYCLDLFVSDLDDWWGRKFWWLQNTSSKNLVCMHDWSNSQNKQRYKFNKAQPQRMSDFTLGYIFAGQAHETYLLCDTEERMLRKENHQFSCTKEEKRLRPNDKSSTSISLELSILKNICLERYIEDVFQSWWYKRHSIDDFDANDLDSTTYSIHPSDEVKAN